MPALLLLMPWIFAAVRIFLIANIAGFVMRILVAVGLNVLLLDPAIDTISAILVGQFGGLPPIVANWIGFLNIDKFFSLTLSAYGIQQTSNFVLRINR